MKKIRITTVLSAVGVLAAGGAAYALNVNVLGSSKAPATSIALQSSKLSTNPAAGSEATTDGTVSAQEVSRSGNSVTYQVGKAGSVMVDSSSGQISISNISPAAGWAAEPMRVDANGVAKVHFVSGATRIEFTVQLVNGQPVVTANLDATAQPSPTVTNQTKPTMPGFNGGDDDDDDGDDHHDSEDHEQEHEDDGDDD